MFIHGRGRSSLLQPDSVLLTLNIVETKSGHIQSDMFDDLYCLFFQFKLHYQCLLLDIIRMLNDVLKHVSMQIVNTKRCMTACLAS